MRPSSPSSAAPVEPKSKPSRRSFQIALKVWLVLLGIHALVSIDRFDSKLPVVWDIVGYALLGISFGLSAYWLVLASERRAPGSLRRFSGFVLLVLGSGIMATVPDDTFLFRQGVPERIAVNNLADRVPLGRAGLCDRIVQLEGFVSDTPSPLSSSTSGTLYKSYHLTAQAQSIRVLVMEFRPRFIWSESGAARAPTRL